MPVLTISMPHTSDLNSLLSSNVLASSQSSLRPLVLQSPLAPASLEKPLKLVNVKLGVMSHCPDALFCENIWDKVIDQVAPLIDMHLLFIGEKNKTEKYGISCKHGSAECYGNIVELCAAEEWDRRSHDIDTSSKPRWLDAWNFVQCLNFSSKLSELGDSAIAQKCATALKLDWTSASLQKCLTTHHGTSLLQHSIKSASKLGITKSCSILIEDKIICVHDGVWKDCPGGHEVVDFVETVRAASQKLNAE